MYQTNKYKFLEGLTNINTLKPNQTKNFKHKVHFYNEPEYSSQTLRFYRKFNSEQKVSYKCISKKNVRI